MPLDVLLSPPALAVLGLLVGSFLNVVIHRLPRMMEREWWGDVAHQLGDADSHQRVFGAAPAPAIAQASGTLEAALDKLPALGIARPASRCPACGHRIRWHENVPVVSWLFLRGRCSACGTAISWRYPFVELLTGALFFAVGWRIGAQPVALAWCAVVAAWIALSAIDWDTTVLPDSITLPLMWAGLLLAAHGLLPGLNALHSVVGAATGYLSLWSVYWLFKLTTGKEGMGHGDFKLLAGIGAWLGWKAILPVLLMASIIGAVVGIGMKFTGALREGRYVPFGPFLAGGAIAVLLVGLPTVLDVIGWG